ncbi:VanW family protein [Actinotignum schaalii]|uniref:VanW family protein n=1 Tax=Actinotignum schaalii TaxID=59505 RepID=UPI00373E6B2D
MRPEHTPLSVGLEDTAVRPAGSDTPFDTGEFRQVEAIRKLRWPWIVSAVIAVLLLVYVGYAWYSADRVARGTTVAGIEIGGMNTATATEHLGGEVAARVARPVEVVVEGTSVSVNPGDYSLGVDAAATVESLTGFTLNPVEIFHRLTGKGEVAPKVTVDDAALSAQVDTIRNTTGVEARNATLVMEGTTAQLSPAQAGRAVDPEATRAALIEQPLRGQERIELEAVPSEPAISTEAAEKARTELAGPLVSGDLTAKVGDRVVNLSPQTLAQAASFVPEGAALQLKLDGKVLGDAVRAAAPDLLKPGVDARIEIVDHTTPTIIPSQDGVGIDDAALATGAQVAALRNAAAERLVELSPAPIPAAFSTADAEKLGVKEVVSEISTPLTSDSVRTTNLRVGTRKVTDTLVKPNETFSLEAALGPIEYSEGFVSSGVVMNGFNNEALGGGLSQLATNVFNIGYLAGYEDVEHRPHTKHFSRYPMGRESTLWSGSIDVKWKNTTPYGAVIDTYLEGGYVVTKLWSTKYYDVETWTSEPRNYRQPVMTEGKGPDCEPQGLGDPGFTVTVSRTVKLGDKVVEDSSYDWTYQPDHGRTCPKPEPATPPAPAPQADGAPAPAPAPAPGH